MISLASNILDVKRSVDAFFENRFDDALEICALKAPTSFYHAFGRAIVHYINATMTLERDDIELGVDSLRHAADLSNRARRQKGIVEGMADWFRKPNYDEYTDGE